MTISQWSTSASNNASGVTGINWAEGQAPATVNNSAREEMAQVADWYRNSAEWIDRNDTVAYSSGTKVLFTGQDVTDIYSVNRRVKVVAPTPGTLYGRITASSTVGSDTDVSISWDSTATLSNESITNFSVGIISGASGAESIDLAAIDRISTTNYTFLSSTSESTKRGEIGLGSTDSVTFNDLTLSSTSTAITLGSPLPIGSGGTGSTTAAAAFSAIKQAATTSATGVVELATDAEVESGTSTSLVITPSALKNAIGFSEYYISSNQTITQAGSLTLAHGIGSEPVMVGVEIECTDAGGDAGYSLGDVIEMPPAIIYDASSGNPYGANINKDSSNLYIRYANISTVFRGGNGTTGIGTNFNNTKWVARFKAWG